MLFFESGDTRVFKDDRNKLFASNEKQIDNHTLMLDILYKYMSVVCTCYCRGVSKKTDTLVAIAMNIRNKVSCNIECFKNFLLLSSIPFTISGTQLKETDYSKIYKF